MAKNPKNTSLAASELGKRGAKKGGIARANVLTAEERKEIARAAVRARWAKAGKLKDILGVDDAALGVADASKPKKSVPKAAEDAEVPFSLVQGTLNFAGVQMECHVLSDGRRVLSSGQAVKVLTGGTENRDLARYLSRNPLFDKDSFASPILFKIPSNPTLAHGMEATTLIEVCDLYIEAAEQGKLHRSQLKIARQAQIIIRACAKVGIIALIDEATGYQRIRQKRALELKLQAFIADEMQEWARMFPEEFWLEIARLEGVRYSPRNRPLRWGKYVMAFVYDAIDSDVGRELRKKNPNPHFLQNHHQWLEKFGRDKVRDQIIRDIAIMQTCDTMDEFKSKFARVFKKTPAQLELTDLWA
jgi:hypothetical protein